MWTSLVAQTVKCPPTMRETRVQSLGQEDPLEKEIATDSSTLAWKIPWTEDPGRLQSVGSQRVGHDWATSLHCTLPLYLCMSTLMVLVVKTTNTLGIIYTGRLSVPTRNHPKSSKQISKMLRDSITLPEALSMLMIVNTLLTKGKYWLCSLKSLCITIWHLQVWLTQDIVFFSWVHNEPRSSQGYRCVFR